MKDISILLPSLRGGGIEKQLLVLAGELVKQGFNLDFVVVNTFDTAYLPDASINLIDLNVRQIRFALPALVRYLREAKPEILLSADTPINSLAIIARLITGVPKRLIISERNHLSSVAKHATRNGDRLRPLLAKYLYPHADLILTVSNSVGNDLVQCYGINQNKILPIHNMFDINKIIHHSKIKPENSWFEKDDRPLIMNIGRMSPQKDQTTLIKAFAILRSRKDCRLLILGEGPERAKLLELAQRLGVADDLLMPGFVANPHAYMSQANVFVLSSAWEGLPGVLIEAMACGIPVVSTNCPGGSAEILENGKYGPLTPAGDEQALAVAILETLAHPPSGEVLRQRAMDFSIENILPQYLSIFQRPLS